MVYLELDLVPLLGNGHEGGSEADGQVVGVHHVLVAELAEVVEESEEVPEDDEDGPGPSVHQLPDLHHEVVLRLQLWNGGSPSFDNFSLFS